ncbi:MAG: type II toxin-antitoxin system prevent-host-death family antitoxin [Actinobacteria bacterium]|nr:type II toxin-antitoxin system prevent-host-death family antitoxin [Actinomycetota bacterium]
MDATVPQKDLRNNVGEVLRRAEGGERLTITVSGRPVAQLGPVEKPRWIYASELDKIFSTPVPRTLAKDLGKFPGGIGDPFQ